MIHECILIPIEFLSLKNFKKDVLVNFFLLNLSFYKSIQKVFEGQWTLKNSLNYSTMKNKHDGVVFNKHR